VLVGTHNIGEIVSTVSCPDAVRYCMTDSRDQPKLAVSRQSVVRDSLGLYVIGIIGCFLQKGWRLPLELGSP